MELTIKALTIEDPLSDIANDIAYQYLFRPFPNSLNEGLLDYRLIRQQPIDTGKLFRPIHGFQNASRVAALIPVLITLYKKYSHELPNELQKELLDLDDLLIKKIQIVGLMRSTGRTKDGDRGHLFCQQGKKECATYFKKLGVDEQEAEYLSDAIISSETKSTKNLITCLIADADLIETFRDTVSFQSKNIYLQYLMFYSMLKEPKNFEAINDIVNLCCFHANVIRSHQGFLLSALKNKEGKILSSQWPSLDDLDYYNKNFIQLREKQRLLEYSPTCFSQCILDVAKVIPLLEKPNLILQEKIRQYPFENYIKNLRKLPNDELVVNYVNDILQSTDNLSKPEKYYVESRKLWSDVVSETEDANLIYLKSHQVKNEVIKRLQAIYAGDTDKLYYDCLNLIQNKTMITMTFKAEHIKNLNDFQLLNMWERDNRNRQSYEDLREKREQELFAFLSTDIKDKLLANKQARPRYGALRLIDTNNDLTATSNYGDSFIAFNEIVKYNSLFAPGDTLDSKNIFKVCTFHHLEFILWQCPDETLKAIVSLVTTGKIPLSFSQDKWNEKTGGYLEVLLPAINIFDKNFVKYIFINENNYQLNKEDLDIFYKLGIPVYNKGPSPYQTLLNDCKQAIKKDDIALLLKIINKNTTGKNILSEENKLLFFIESIKNNSYNSINFLKENIKNKDDFYNRLLKEIIKDNKTNNMQNVISFIKKESEFISNILHKPINQDGDTFLHYAAKCDAVEMIMLLHEMGISLNVSNSKGESIFSYLNDNSFKKLLNMLNAEESKILIDLIKEKQLSDILIKILFNKAMNENNKEILQCLFEQKFYTVVDDYNQSLFDWAIKEGNLIVANDLVKVNVPFFVKNYDKNFFFLAIKEKYFDVAFFYVLKESGYEFAKYLLQFGIENNNTEIINKFIDNKKVLHDENHLTLAISAKFNNFIIVNELAKFHNYSFCLEQDQVDMAIRLALESHHLEMAIFIVNQFSQVFNDSIKIDLDENKWFTNSDEEVDEKNVLPINPDDADQYLRLILFDEALDDAWIINFHRLLLLDNYEIYSAIKPNLLKYLPDLKKTFISYLQTLPIEKQLAYLDKISPDKENYLALLFNSIKAEPRLFSQQKTALDEIKEKLSNKNKYNL